MNSDHAPTAHELPPLDEQYRKLTADLDGSDPLDADVAVRLALECRKRQLRASLQNAANLESELAIARDLIATMRARIEELEDVWDCAMSQSVGLRYDYKGEFFVNARAEAAEAQLRAVSDALEEKLPVYQGNYRWEDVDARDARIRAILSPVRS